MNKKASAVAAGSTYPSDFAEQVEKKPAVRQVLHQLAEKVLEEIQWGRTEAHEMYQEAWRNCDSATEQKLVVDSLVKLHGVSAPEKVEHTHDHKHHHEIELNTLPDDELLRLADFKDGITLDGEFEEIQVGKTDCPPLLEDTAAPAEK